MKSFFNILFLLLLLGGCKPHQTVYSNQLPVLSLDSTLSESSKINQLITPYKAGLQAEMDVVIGYSPMFLEKKRPSSILGDFMAEAIYFVAKESLDMPIDYCLLNYGGIRSTLDSGEITVGDIFELMPFENEIVVLVLDKFQMKELFKQINANGGEPFANHLIDNKTQNDVMYQNTFSIATSDYIANGGDNYTILTKAIERRETGIKVRDGLMTYIKQHNPIPVDFQPSKN